MADENTPNTEETSKAPATPEFKTVKSFDEIADTLADSMPEVQQHAVDQHNAEEQAQQNQHADTIQQMEEKAGERFDPEAHATTPEGLPSVTKTGKFRKKAGRKSASAGTSGSTLGSVDNKPATMSPEQQAKVVSRANGRATAELIFAVGTAIGGKEWMPIKDDNSGIDERAQMTDAWAAYYEATGKQDLPPGLIVTVAMVSYAAPRFTMPQTQTRAQKVVTWFKAKMANRKLKKHGLQAKPAEEK